MTRDASSDGESKRPLPPPPESILAERDPAFDAALPQRDEEFQNLFRGSEKALKNAFPGDETDIGDVRF